MGSLEFQVIQARLDTRASRASLDILECPGFLARLDIAVSVGSLDLVVHQDIRDSLE